MGLQNIHIHIQSITSRLVSQESSLFHKCACMLRPIPVETCLDAFSMSKAVKIREDLLVKEQVDYHQYIIETLLIIHLQTHL